MSRRRDGSKKTAPTTVRFSRDLEAWVRQAAEGHPEGMTGVINDAVRLYREKIEAKGERILNGIVGSPG
jgi:hypothetical protein